MAQIEPQFKHSYVAAAGANNVIKAAPGYLHAVILGKFVSGGIVEVSDHASDGNGNVKVYLTAGTTDTCFPKTVLVQAKFQTGICADITNFTNVTFIYR